MTREIAVFRGNDGATAALGEPGTVAVYRRKQGRWELSRQQEWDLDSRKGLKEFRRQITEIATFLGTCKVFVARTITGLPYYEMEKAGISTWEVTGPPAGFLTEIALQDAAVREEVVETVVKQVVPLEVAPGHWSVSIKEVQEQESGITSKQVLLPILRRLAFTSLAIDCNHLPPWLEVEITGRGLVFQTEKLGGNHYKVIVSRPSVPV
ncbi:MAG: Fe-only nitrogenase accessory AnfO family protein [Negativicutes bacterium]|nr:Fe-only nitrogenase accessory AnfO family protein [Negativicutes bacterium]